MPHLRRASKWKQGTPQPFIVNAEGGTLVVERGFTTMAAKMMAVGQAVLCEAATPNGKIQLTMHRLPGQGDVTTNVLEVSTDTGTILHRCGVTGARIDGLKGLHDSQGLVFGSSADVSGMRRVCEHVVSRALPTLCSSSLPQLCARLRGETSNATALDTRASAAVDKLFEYSKYMNGKATRRLRHEGFGSGCFEMMHLLPSACKQAGCLEQLVIGNEARVLDNKANLASTIADSVATALNGKAFSVSCPQGAVRCLCIEPDDELHKRLSRCVGSSGRMLACVASQAGKRAVFVFKKGGARQLNELVESAVCCL